MLPNWWSLERRQMATKRDFSDNSMLKMDAVKEEISMKMLCNACLCIGNTLYQVTDDKLKRYYLSALKEIPLCNMPAISPVLCVDCTALLNRSHNFREQVKDSYRILITYTSENLNECLLTDVSRPPRLRIEKKDCIDIAPHSSDAINGDFDKLLDDRILESSEKCEEYTIDSNDQKVLTSLKHGLSCDILYGKTHVFVKEELKFEDCDSDRDADFDIPLIDLKQCDTLADITDLQTNDGSECILDKIKKKQLKRSKKNGKIKKKKTKEGEESEAPNILTIHMTYEEMVEERQKELERDSYINAEFKCESCILGFNYNKSYKKHLLTKHSPNIGKYSCPICKTVLPTVESFSTHYKRHMKRFECGSCGARARDLRRAQQHYACAHRAVRANYECARCGHVANSLDAHRYHIDTHKARLACADCDKTFRHRGGLLNHRLTVHEARNRFPCTSCDKVFRWKNSLKRHMPVHDQKNASGAPAAAHCAACRVSFASVGSYRRHLANSLHHVTKEHFRFICDHCNGRFADKTKLRDHIEEKHLHKTYQCNVCLKTFMNRVNLDQHSRNVHRGRPNNKMCHHCGKGFPTKAQLESHIRTHTGERPYICELCPTTFSQHSNLYKHNRQVHLNMKSKRYPSGKKTQSNPIVLPLEPTQLPIEYPVHIDFTM